MRLRFPYLMLILVGALSILLARNASAVVFDDGLVHVIDAANSFPFESVEAIDSASGDPTTVNVVDGGVQ
jgi:hypothetical protein